MLERNNIAYKNTNGFAIANIPRAPETFRYHAHYRDSIAVQRRQNKVNDDEVHKLNGNLENILTPHHEFHVDEENLKKPILSRPCKSILHNPSCPSRHSCEIVESKRRVTFNEVIVRDYDMTLGDHPDCSYGPPVSIGWDYLEYEPIDVNEYESNHSRRRPLRHLLLNYYKRKHILQDVKEEDLKAAVKEIKKVYMLRQITRQFVVWWKVEDGLETICRRARRVVKKDLPPDWQPEDELDWSRHSKSPILKKREGELDWSRYSK